MCDECGEEHVEIPKAHAKIILESLNEKLPDLGTLVRCKRCHERYLGVKEDDLCYDCKNEIKINQDRKEQEKPE